MTTRLLVADDEADIRVLVGLRVRHLDVQVIAVADGVAAMAACSGDPPPDVVVLDQRMPGHSGLQVARAVRAASADLPIAIFSAFVDGELAREARDVGAVVHSKSDLGALVAWVEGHLASAPA